MNTYLLTEKPYFLCTTTQPQQIGRLAHVFLRGQRTMLRVGCRLGKNYSM